jgi:hypothetical protein
MAQQILISSPPGSQNSYWQYLKNLNHARLWGCGAFEYPGDGSMVFLLVAIAVLGHRALLSHRSTSLSRLFMVMSINMFQVSVLASEAKQDVT